MTETALATQDIHKTTKAVEIIGDLPVKSMVTYPSPDGDIVDYTYGYDVMTVDDQGNRHVDPVKNFHFVREQLEDDPILPTGYHILVKTWANDPVLERLKKIGLHSPSGKEQDDLDVKHWYESRMGLVLRMGPDAYASRARYPNQSWCEVGDFIQVQFHAKSLTRIHGTNKRYHYLFTTTDDKIMNIIKNPYKIVNELNYT